MQAGRIQQSHRDLITHLISFLTTEGYLEAQGSEWIVKKDFVLDKPLLSELMVQYPEF